MILEAYGWLPPIDDPKLGFGRGNLYHRDAMVLLAGYIRYMGFWDGENDQLSLSYLQVIFKLSNYPSHGTTPTLVFDGVNDADRCFDGHIYCWQFHWCL